MNGVFLAVCTQNFGSQLSTTAAFVYLSQYLEGSYFTGQLPPPDAPVPQFPYTVILDLETGQVALKDGTISMSISAILAYVDVLNND
jgi:hypothetical protein